MQQIWQMNIKFFLSWIIVAFGQPAWLPWLAPFSAAIGFALFWEAVSKIPFSRSRFWIGVLWFALVQCLQLSWMTSIEFQGWYIIYVYLIFAFCLGLEFGLITLFIDKIPLVMTAALWVILEWLRIHFFCGFSWNPVGLSLTSFPITLQIASVFGVFGLSFLVFLTNLAYWKRRWKVAISLTLLPYFFGAAQLKIHDMKIKNSSTLTVGLIQTALLPSEKMRLKGRDKDYIQPKDQWKRIVRLCNQNREKLDLLVLPECAVPYADNYQGYLRNEVEEILKEEFKNDTISEALKLETSEEQVSNRFWIQMISKILKADVIAGLESKRGELHFESAFFYSYAHQFGKHYDKQILVPLAEYVPFDWVKKFTKKYGITNFFTPGKEPVIFPSKVSLAPSICYEETFSYLIRKGKLRGANLLVNLTNDNWYPNSRLPKQHFDHAKIRAVENGMPMARCCNTGITAVVDSLGRVVSHLSDEKKAAILVAKVPLHSYFTFYSLWGDKGILGMCLVCLIISFYANRKNLYQYIIKNRKESCFEIHG